MFGKFKIKGNRAHLRSEEELVNVDKAEADDAFKKYKQAVLDKYLAEKGFGSRLGKLICDKDIWWDYANETIAQVSFQNVANAIERFVMPWFDKYATEDVLMKKLMEDKKKSEQTGRGIPYKNAEWLNALEERGDRTEIILENIEKLKLPKKIK